MVKLSICLVFVFFINGCAFQPTMDWNKTIKNVSSGVVSIQIDVPVAFDGKSNLSTQATGFVVDAQRGIILTNRHVMTPGPVSAKAIFINNEEISLTPLYFDPVHDFGFFSYKPSELQHLTPHEFELRPDSVYVGQEIRIIGNDAGQKIAILDGTISRLYRAAPNYGKGRYNDFNTFYIQATTASSGGSSGSPVIDKRGNVVALNAGNRTKSSTAFYLPLEKVVDALSKLQQDATISRGTLQTTFKLTPYSELKRLGLDEKTEAEFRKIHPDINGMLVVDSLLPGTSAHEHLDVGDILLTINGSQIKHFVRLENWLNDNLSNSIDIEVMRRGEIHRFTVGVDDLNKITPVSYMKFDDSIFHDLSYQQARHFNQSVSGVYVANSSSGFSSAGIPSHSLIVQINDQPVANLEEFVGYLSNIPDGDKVHIRYLTRRDPKSSYYTLLEVSRKWFDSAYCQRDWGLGYWPCEVLSAPVSASASNVIQNGSSSYTSILEKNGRNGVESSLVKVMFSSPYSFNGRGSSSSRYGTGLVVDAMQGLVMVDRSVAVSMLGDVKIIFGNRIEIPGKVKYIHPLHNLALVEYSPKLVKDFPVRSAPLATKPLKRGDWVQQIGLNYDGETEYRETEIELIEELWLKEYNVPQYVDKNLDGIHLIDANYNVDGVLLNKNNEVGGFWATFEEAGEKGRETHMSAAGIPVEFIYELIELAKTDKTTYTLDVGLTYVPPIQALKRGVPEHWLEKILSVNPERQKLLTIYSVSGALDRKDLLKRGDILLAINGQPVSSYRQVELLSQHESLRVTLFRDGREISQNVDTVKLNGQDIDRILFWSGLSLHAPHRAVQQQRGMKTDGVYIASYRYGSPAHRQKVYAMRRIVEIDGQPISNADDFIEAVKHKKHNESVVLKTLDVNNQTKVYSITVNNHYWPFYEVRYDKGEWKKTDHLSEKKEK